MAVMKDVARLAGVSITTVSFVLNGTAKEHKVADKTASKVLKAAKQLGYKANSADHGDILRYVPTTIAFFTPMNSARMDMGVVYDTIHKHIKQTQNQYNILLCPYERGLLPEKIRQVDAGSYDAAVVVVDNSADAENLEKIEESMPFVLYNAHSKRFSSVFSNAEDPIRQAVTMIAAKGYRRIVLMAGSENGKSGNEYLSDLIRICSEQGITIPDQAFITTENTTMGGGIAAHHILGMESKPEMIICMNSSLAYGAIPVLARNEFFVPKNAELLCFGTSGDADLVMNYIPSLSMIMIPVDEITTRAFDIALHLSCDRDTQPLHLTCPCTLLLNRSFSI